MAALRKISLFSSGKDGKKKGNGILPSPVSSETLRKQESNSTLGLAWQKATSSKADVLEPPNLLNVPGSDVSTAQYHSAFSSASSDQPSSSSSGDYTSVSSAPAKTWDPSTIDRELAHDESPLHTLAHTPSPSGFIEHLDDQSDSHHFARSADLSPNGVAGSGHANLSPSLGLAGNAIPYLDYPPNTSFGSDQLDSDSQLATEQNPGAPDLNAVLQSGLQTTYLSVGPQLMSGSSSSESSRVSFDDARSQSSMPLDSLARSPQQRLWNARDNPEDEFAPKPHARQSSLAQPDQSIAREQQPIPAISSASTLAPIRTDTHFLSHTTSTASIVPSPSNTISATHSNPDPPTPYHHYTQSPSPSAHAMLPPSTAYVPAPAAAFSSSPPTTPISSSFPSSNALPASAPMVMPLGMGFGNNSMDVLQYGMVDSLDMFDGNTHRTEHILRGTSPTSSKAPSLRKMPSSSGLSIVTSSPYEPSMLPGMGTSSPISPIPPMPSLDNLRAHSPKAAPADVGRGVAPPHRLRQQSMPAPQKSKRGFFSFGSKKEPKPSAIDKKAQAAQRDAEAQRLRAIHRGMPVPSVSEPDVAPAMPRRISADSVMGPSGVDKLAPTRGQMRPSREGRPESMLINEEPTTSTASDAMTQESVSNATPTATRSFSPPFFVHSNTSHLPASGFTPASSPALNGSTSAIWTFPAAVSSPADSSADLTASTSLLVSAEPAIQTQAPQADSKEALAAAATLDPSGDQTSADIPLTAESERQLPAERASQPIVQAPMELQPAEPVSATTAGPSSAEQAKAPSAPAPLKTAQQTAITSSPTTARVAGVSKRASVQSRPQSTGSRLSAFFSRSKTSRQSVDADEPRRTSVTSVVSVSPAAVPEPIQAPTETAEIHASQLTPTLGASGARAPSTEDANLQQGDVATPSLQKTDHLDEWQIGASPTGFNLVQVSEQLADLSQATQEPICGVPQLTTSAAALHLQGSLSSSSAASDESSSRRISESETPITDVGVSPFGSSPDPSLRKSRVSSTTTVPEDDEETTEKEMLGIASADSQAALDLICELHPRFEYAMTEFPRRILMGIVKHLDYVDMRPLRDLSKGMRRLLNSDSVRELVVSRYLVSFGYRTLPPELLMSTPHGSATSPTSPSAPKAAPIQISLRDLDAFQVGLEIGLGEYSALARDHRAQPLDAVTQQMLKAATRAWNRVVLRVRSQPPMSADEKRAIIERGITLSSVYRHGRAPLLRVWVPAAGNWMNDDELVECEREVWRSGAWPMVRKGDIVWNAAIGDFGNEGKLVHDGRYLRDLSYTFDPVGHLPPWLSSMTLPPSYFHNIIASSMSNPVIYLDMTPFLPQVQQTLSLCQDKVDVAAPQGRYRVTKYVYRAAIRVQPGFIISNNGGAGGAGPGGLDVMHDDWAGQIIIETEGTTEHAHDLLRRCTPAPPLRVSQGSAGSSAKPSNACPWRIMRERSRPGKLWLQPILDSERVA